MPSRVAALSCCAALVLLTVAVPARAWIENHVLGDEVRLEIDATGKALVEHRITLKTTGNERLQSFTIRGVDRDALVQGNSYVIPARDALSSSLDSATPVTMELRHPERPKRHGIGTGESAEELLPLPPAELVVRVDHDRGLRRGAYVFVLRYRTDLRARGLLERDGALVRIRWVGPIWDDGFDNARVLFVVPPAPTSPRAEEEPTADIEEDEAVLLPRYLSEVRRTQVADEVELLRSYLPKGEAVPWGVRVDQRALDPLPDPEPAAAPSAPDVVAAVARGPAERGWLIGAAASLFVLYSLLVLLKARQVARRARPLSAVVRPWVPLPLTLRAILAGAAVTGGVALQLLFQRPLAGSLLVVAAAVLAALGTARVEPGSTMRGPGRWLAVSEAEALRPAVAPSGVWLDAGTRLGALALLLALSLLACAVWALWELWDAPYRAALVALDAVALLALWGTGRCSALPANMAVAPIPFLRRLSQRIRRAKAGRDLKVVARLRIPEGAAEPDEIRLLIAPRLPRRGFGGIEVGLTYAIGLGARVACPEVLLRVSAGSPCEEAVASLAAFARQSPGRRPAERVLAFAPRFPTVRMTAEIVVALAARVRHLDLVVPAPRREGQASSSVGEGKTRAAA